MRVAITGATGSLGGALIRVLAENGVAERIVSLSRDEVKSGDLAERWPDLASLKCMLGDVRDTHRLEEVFRGCDTVIHCLDRFTPITLANGERLPIGEIVRRRLATKIRSWDGRAFRDAEITGWYENRRGARRMICLSWDGGRIGGTRRQLWLTEDHRVLTPGGWRPAGDLEAGDRVLTGEPSPNQRQLAFLAGTLLGDSSFVRRQRGRSELTVSHALRQQEWIALKSDILAEFQPRFARRSLRTPVVCDVLQVGTRRWASLGKLAALWYPEKKKRIPLAWLEGRLRSAPALVLAAWYLDDGCLIQGRTAELCTDGFEREDIVGIAKVLQATLGLSARIVDQKCGGGRTRTRLRCSGGDADRLFDMIGRGIPDSMRYKVPATAASYDVRFWDLGQAESHVGLIVKNEAAPWTVNQRQKQQRVFCLGIRETETFVAGGLLVHNCAALKRISHSVYSPGEMVKTNVQGTLNVIHAAMAAGVQRVLVISSDKCCAPVNLYGATKFVAECYAVQSNSYGLPRGMSVACARYGNVLGSRGSVVHLWREQLRQGQPLMITDPGMTRFIITLRQAADFILRALGDMEGGEIFVPQLPATRIDALAHAVAVQCLGHNGDVPTVITGLRPGGEKLHEALLSSEEPQRSYQVGDRIIILPSHHSWRGTWEIPGERMAGSYTSDAPTRWLSIDEMVEMLKEVPDGH